MVKMLSGKMAAPDNIHLFNKYHFKDITVFVSKEQCSELIEIFIPYFGKEIIALQLKEKER